MPSSDKHIANLILCEQVLHEGSIKSAIRIIDLIYLAPLRDFANFFSLTFLHPASPEDRAQHSLVVRMVRSNSGGPAVVATAPPYSFNYIDVKIPSVVGSAVLATEFIPDVASLEPLGTFMVQALVDDSLVAQSPITLRRSG